MRNRIVGGVLLLLTVYSYAEVIYNTSPNVIYIPTVQVSSEKDKQTYSDNEQMFLDEERLNQTQVETEQLRNWWSHQMMPISPIPSKADSVTIISNKVDAHTNQENNNAVNVNITSELMQGGSGVLLPENINSETGNPSRALDSVVPSSASEPVTIEPDSASEVAH